ncbi:MAG: HEAT repeat domain-containing protein [Planctomycetes bacterium]|nr:HEAT repeat domain-containing protein [Planctomycetota bacterium]
MPLPRPLRRIALGLGFALALAAGPASPAAAGDGKPDLPAVVKAVASFMKKKSLGKRDPADLARKLDGLSGDDLSWVLDRLEEVPEKERGEAAGEVLGRVRDAVLTDRYGAAVLEVPDAWSRLRDPSDAVRAALLSDLARLEDAEPGTRFALWAMEGSTGAVRLRALDTLADLASYGGDEARILPALRKALEDPSPAVRDLALERLANLSDPSVLDWALARAGEPASEEAEVRGVKEVRCPGDRALHLLSRVSKIRFGLEGEAFRALPAEERGALLEEWRKWRASAGPNPLRNGDDGPFDPLPRTTSVVVDPAKATTATLRWWSEVDRAQFRLDLEDLEVVAVTKIDWTANFRLLVIASGARQGDWEAFARKIPCGTRHRLPRKGFGLVETTVQPLLGGKWKVWVRAFESRGK